MKKTALFLLLLLAATSLWSQDDTVANRFREQYARLGKEYTQWPDNVVVLPGHGPQTTIGKEVATNPFIDR